VVRWGWGDHCPCRRRFTDEIDDEGGGHNIIIIYHNTSDWNVDLFTGVQNIIIIIIARHPITAFDNNFNRNLMDAKSQ